MNKVSGIYVLENKVDGKKYIGSSNDIARRKKEHYYDLRHSQHINPHLQNAWNKYGEENFMFKLIDYPINNETLLLEREDSWMIKYNSLNKKYGYNLKTAARQIPTEETKRKMSLAGKGRIMSAETKKKLSLAKKGKKLSPKLKELACKQLVHGFGKDNPFYGKKHTEETKKKLSILNKGRKHTEETIKKMSESSKRPNPPKDCKFCGQPFKKTSYSITQKANFCSRECSNKNKIIKVKPKECIFCKKLFKKNTISQQKYSNFCSTNCRMTFIAKTRKKRKSSKKN